LPEDVMAVTARGAVEELSCVPPRRKLAGDGTQAPMIL
jgi:hypothetical protein